MKQRPLSTYTLLGLTAAGLLLSLFPAQSADLYWKPQGGSSLWDTTLENWSPTSDAATHLAWASGAGNSDIALFEGTGSLVTIGGSFSAGGLKFTGNGYQFSASSLQTLTLTGDAPAIEVGAGLTTTFGNNFRLASTSKSFSKTGAGTLELAGTGFADPNFFLGGISSGTSGAKIALDEGIIKVSGNSLNNSYTEIAIASGAELQVNATMNIGGLSGSGAITNSGSTLRNIQIRGANADFSGTISGNISLTSNNGVDFQRFSGTASNTFTGHLTVDVGEIILAKTNDAVAVSGTEIRLGGGTTNTAPNSRALLTLAGENQISSTTDLAFVNGNYRVATFSLDGHSAAVGSLIVNSQGAANSNGRYLIDFGENSLAQILSFDGIVVDGSGIVEILNLSENDELRFTLDPTAYLGSLLVNGGQAQALDMEEYWRVVAIPEPTTVVLLLGGLLAVGAFRRRRR